jgi:hypothetical protein
MNDLSGHRLPGSLPLVMLFVVMGLACGPHNDGRPITTPVSSATPISNKALAQPVEPTPYQTSAPSPIAHLVRTTSFIWPYNGRVTSYFGPGHPLGIDIAIDPGEVAPVRASGAGTVEFAGGDACCEYGYYVVLRHPMKITTLYAHLANISVTAGQEVSQGEVIGYGGQTGKTDGPHLHFEMNRGETLVDPLRFLPKSPDLPGQQESTACGDTISVLAPESLAFLRFDPEFMPGLSLKYATLIPEPRSANLEVHDDRPYDELTVSFEEPAPNLAAGEVVERILTLQFGDEHGTTKFRCRFVTPTNVTLANAPTAIDHVKRALPTPTPIRNRPISTASATPTATPKASYEALTPPKSTKTPTKPSGAGNAGPAINTIPPTIAPSQQATGTRTSTPALNAKPPTLVPSPKRAGQ